MGSHLNFEVSEISFSYERMSTKTRFKKEAKSNSEMVYLQEEVSELLFTLWIDRGLVHSL